jgi:hypothetical protein
MATEADPSVLQSDSLTAILEHEVRVCQALLEANEALEAALEPLDFGALEAAMSARGHALRNLEALEARAQVFRGPGFVPSADLADRLRVLKEYPRQIREADNRVRNLARKTMEGLRAQINGVNRGQRVLQGYRGSAQQMPRFADKRG